MSLRIPIRPPYDLERTLLCGQCFRWTVTPDGARGILAGTVAVVRQDPDRLSVRWEGPAGSLPRLRRHLGADAPLNEIEAALARDRVLRRLLPQTSGTALMRQDPWECLVSYVVSAFNNIPKISLSIETLARRFGAPIWMVQEAERPAGERSRGQERKGGSVAGWSFPQPDRLAQVRLEGLRACALGYRARYVRDLARMVACGDVDLDTIARLPFDEARAALLDLPGVGEKVADCVLLFAYGRGEAFPVDVWVQRAVERWYFGGRALGPRRIHAWARDRFGPLAGYAQQHLFVGMRLQGTAR